MPTLPGTRAKGHAPPEGDRHEDQRHRRQARDAKGCPQDEISPIVLEQVEPVERSRQSPESSRSLQNTAGCWSAVARQRHSPWRSQASRHGSDSARQGGPTWWRASAPCPRRQEANPPLPIRRARRPATHRLSDRWRPHRRSWHRRLSRSEDRVAILRQQRRSLAGVVKVRQAMRRRPARPTDRQRRIGLLPAGTWRRCPPPFGPPCLAVI